MITSWGMATRFLRLVLLALALGGTSAPAPRAGYAEVAPATATCLATVAPRSRHAFTVADVVVASPRAPHASVVRARAAIASPPSPLSFGRRYVVHRALLL